LQLYLALFFAREVARFTRHDHCNCDRPRTSGSGDDRGAAVVGDRHNSARHPFYFFRGAGHHHRGAEADRGRVWRYPLGAGISGLACLARIRNRRHSDGTDRGADRRALDSDGRRADDRCWSCPVERRRTLVALYRARSADGGARQCRDQRSALLSISRAGSIAGVAPHWRSPAARRSPGRSGRHCSATRSRLTAGATRCSFMRGSRLS
jgi:hypothetical protein